MRVRRWLPETNELAYYIDGADADQYWDRMWVNSAAESRLTRTLARRQRFSFESLVTSLYLPRQEGPVLEGGCGNGRVLSQLSLRGYRCVGIDSSAPAVRMLHRCAPHLDVRLGDVQALPFPDAYFAGYWSIGVIEHFQQGYREVLSEAYRVLKPGGVLFVSFPVMNGLRRWKAAKHHYPVASQDTEPGTFFQYALESSRVLSNLEDLGFRRQSALPMGFFFGIADELPRTARAIGRLDRLRSLTGPTSIAYMVADAGFSMLGGRAVSHSLLLVLRRPW